MALDKTIRNALQSTVTKIRLMLEEDFARQLELTYGIKRNGEVREIDSLSQLSDEDFTIARALRTRLKHLVKRGEQKGSAVIRIIREQSFTILNRFCALKMAEKRGLLRECVSKGYNSEGYKLFTTICGNSIGTAFEKYRVYLLSILDELALDLRVLFDRFSAEGMLFPGEKCLENLFNELNDKELDRLWDEDETIGWIYQFFNDPDERKKMRKAGAPRNSRELAVRNQFFTPRYVVRFLVDNTLGKLWYEMTEGNTAFTDELSFLVKKTEMYTRTIKDPREITLLDPACGSMHFGLYAFDLFEKIYEEAWNNYPELLIDLRDQYESREEFLQAVPGLILKHNIHGIDIDRRAVQIAGLSLYLRVQRRYKELGIPPEKRPRLQKANVVCAEPMPGDTQYLEEYTSSLEPKVLGDLVTRIWQEMKLAGEAGSLLEIDITLDQLVKKAKEAWKKYTDEMKGYIQGDLFDENREKQIKLELGFDVSDIENIEEWEGMEARLLSVLSNFAELGGIRNNYSRKLFAEDAASGFAFIDVCRKRYDVVVMNPPFGDCAKRTKKYIADHYPRTKNDVYAAFIEANLNRLNEHGYIGAITSRTGFFLSSFQKWREEIILGEARPTVFADLGFGVLDAMVETAAYCLIKN